MIIIFDGTEYAERRIKKICLNISGIWPNDDISIM